MPLITTRHSNTRGSRIPMSGRFADSSLRLIGFPALSVTLIFKKICT